MRQSKNTWEQIKAGYAAGIGLREIARKMNVAQGTVLARAKRDNQTSGNGSDRMRSIGAM
jgi:IS30 family transposase